VAVTPKVLEFEARLEPDGSFRSEDAELRPHGWSSEALVLAGLMRCSVASLRHSAKRAGFTLASASSSAHATVTRRESDGRYAFTVISVELDATLDPAPTPEQTADLIARAENGCFVGASLTPAPRYAWRIA
jgi:organic hydroperoxide reductase OsmC/OhrA